MSLHVTLPSDEPTDRRNQDDCTALSLDHLRCNHCDEPVIREDIVIEDLPELFIADGGGRAEMRITGGVADEHIDLPEMLAGLVHHPL